MPSTKPKHTGSNPVGRAEDLARPPRPGLSPRARHLFGSMGPMGELVVTRTGSPDILTRRISDPDAEKRDSGPAGATTMKRSPDGQLRRRPIGRRASFIPLLTVGAVALFSGISTSGEAAQSPAGERRAAELKAQLGSGAEVRLSAETGFVRFLGTTPRRPVNRRCRPHTRREYREHS